MLSVSKWLDVDVDVVKHGLSWIIASDYKQWEAEQKY